MTQSRATICPIAVALIVWSPALLRAQDTRAEVIADQQEKKSTELTPEKPSKAEEWIVRFKNDLLISPSGFYPTFDSVYPGGGFTVGLGYRQYYTDTTFFNVDGLYSIKGYKAVRVSTTSHGWMQNRLDVTAHAGWRDATQVEFFGVGNDTAPEDLANFGVTQTYGGGAVNARPLNWIRLRGTVDYEQYSDERGTGRRSPSIEQLYTPLTAPGLGGEPTYLHFAGSAGIDWRTSPGYSRRGGFYGGTIHSFADRDDVFTFNEVELEAVQHVPILRENWVISMRGRVQTILDDDDVVPYYLLPSLGSGNTLRGYRTGRFRDRHAVLTSIEYRWIPNLDALDMAIFYDAGEVASRREDIDTKGWHHDWGFGARFHGPAATALRLELARGSEGWQVIFAGGAAF